MSKSVFADNHDTTKTLDGEEYNGGNELRHDAGREQNNRCQSKGAGPRSI